MPKKRKLPKSDDPEQSTRFVELADRTKGALLRIDLIGFSSFD
jgi:hypothetical protein